MAPEIIAEAEPNGVGLNAVIQVGRIAKTIGRNSKGAICRIVTVLRAEIGVTIFRPQRPGVAQAMLDTCANGPAHSG